MLRLLFFLILAAASLVYCQSFTASITGTVTDQTGAAIPGASVKAVNTGTNAVYGFSAGSNGNYSIPQLSPARTVWKSMQQDSAAMCKKGSRCR
jgi:hypothetical protein